MSFYEWQWDQSRMPSCHLDWPHVAKMAQIWLFQGSGTLSEVKQEAKPLPWQDMKHQGEASSSLHNNSCGERWACLPVYVRAAPKPLKVTRFPSIRRDYLLNSSRPSCPLLTQILIFLSLWLWPATWHKQRLASLEDHPASVTGAVISGPLVKWALIGVWCNEVPSSQLLHRQLLVGLGNHVLHTSD